MRNLVFFLEEESMRVTIKEILKKIGFEGWSVKLIPFEGKSDLEKQLLLKMKHWNVPDTFFIIVRDKDSGDCIAIKRKLLDICLESGKPSYKVRIACHELENWFLGDLAAVERVYGGKISAHQTKSKFRTPDDVANAVQELNALTNNRYQKLNGSREISKYLNLDNNMSSSFNVFIRTIKGLK